MSQGSWRTRENLDYNEMLTANYTSEQERSIWHCRASFSNCLVGQCNARQMNSGSQTDTGNVGAKGDREAEGNVGCWAMWVFTSVLQLGQVSRHRLLPIKLVAHHHQLRSYCSKTFLSRLITRLLFQWSVMFTEAKWTFGSESMEEFAFSHLRKYWNRGGTVMVTPNKASPHRQSDQFAWCFSKPGGTDFREIHCSGWASFITGGTCFPARHRRWRIATEMREAVTNVDCF